MAEATHLLGLPRKHKPKDIQPQGEGSGLDADKVDGLHASELGGGGPHAPSHETGGGDLVHFADLEHDEGDSTLHDAFTSTPHISQSEKNRLVGGSAGVLTDQQHGDKTSIPSAHHTKTASVSELTDHDKAAHDALGIDAATLEGSTKAQVQDHAPKAHKASHESGGGDALNLGSLAGTLTATQHPSGLGADKHHRAWALLDEQGWNRSFVLPLVESGQWKKRFSNLLVISGNIGHPCLVRQLYDGYKYWLAVYDGANRYIKVYKSNDLETWTYVCTPISLSGQSWHSYMVHNPALIYDRFETDSNKRWKLFYQGTNSSTWYTYDQVGYAYASSPDGPWTDYSGNPIYGPSGGMNWGLSVIRFNNMFFMIWSPPSADAIRGVTATTPTGTWTDRGILLGLGETGEWDASQVRYASFWFNQGVWYILYSGLGASPLNHFQIGMAVKAGKILGTYDRWDMNPIVQYNTEPGIDDTHVLCPTMIEEDSGFYCLYDCRGSSQQGIACRHLPKYEV